MKTWIVVAHRSQARIFELAGPDHVLRLVQTLDNPEGKLKNQDINASRPGIATAEYGWSASVRTRLTKKESPTERVAHMFAKKISGLLEKAFDFHQFDEVVLVAEAHFMGKLRGCLGKNVTRQVSKILLKDLAHLSDYQVKEYLKPQLMWQPEPLVNPEEVLRA